MCTTTLSVHDHSSIKSKKKQADCLRNPPLVFFQIKIKINIILLDAPTNFSTSRCTKIEHSILDTQYQYYNYSLKR